MEKIKQMKNKSKDYVHKNWTTIPKNFDKKTGIFINVLNSVSMLGKIEGDSPIYSVIFEIPGYDYTEMVTKRDYDHYISKVNTLFEHLVLDWNIIGVNKTIDLSAQIDFWTKRLERCKEGEFAKAEVCQNNREIFLNFSRYYQEPFDFLEVFSRNKSTLVRLEEFLPKSKEITLRKITDYEEAIQIKKAVLNPLGRK